MKNVLIIFIGLMLVSVGCSGAVKIDTDQINWSQSLPSGDGIIFSGTAPGTTTNALYSDGGVMKFNGDSLDKSASDIIVGWDGSAAYARLRDGTELYSGATNATALQYAIDNATASRPYIFIETDLILAAGVEIDNTYLTNGYDHLTINGGWHNISITANAPALVIDGTAGDLYAIRLRNLVLQARHAAPTNYTLYVNGVNRLGLEGVSVVNQRGTSLLSAYFGDTQWSWIGPQCQFIGSTLLSGSNDNLFLGAWFNQYSSTDDDYAVYLSTSGGNKFSDCHFIGPVNTSGACFYVGTTSTHNFVETSVMDGHNLVGAYNGTSGYGVVDTSGYNTYIGNDFYHFRNHAAYINSEYNSLVGNRFLDNNAADNSKSDIYIVTGKGANIISGGMHTIGSSRSNKGYWINDAGDYNSFVGNEGSTTQYTYSLNAAAHDYKIGRTI